MSSGSPTDVPKPGSGAFLDLKKRERDFCEAYHGRADGVTGYDLLTSKEQEWVENYFRMGRNATAASRAMGYAAPEKHGWRMSNNVHVRAVLAERLAGLRIEANEVLYRIEQRATATAEDFLRFDTVQRRPKVWAPVAVAIEEKRHEVEVERETIARLGLSGKDRQAADADLEKLERELVRLEVVQERDPDRVVRIRGPVEERVVASFDLARMRDAGKLHLIKSVKRLADGGFSVEMHSAEKADELLGKHLGLFTERLDLTTGGEPLKEIRVTVVPPRSRGADQRGE